MSDSRRFLFLVGIALVSSGAMAEGTEWQKWQARDRVFRSEMDIVTVHGRIEASKLRSRAAELEFQRLIKLEATRAITPARLQKSDLDRKLAAIEEEELRAELSIASTSRRLNDVLPGCQTGNAADCDQLNRDYRAIFDTRIQVAELAVRRAKANLAYRKFMYDSQVQLVERNALDAGVLAEERIRLESFQQDLVAAESQLKLAKEAAAYSPFNDLGLLSRMSRSSS